MAGAAKLVLGPGTGLGVAALIDAGGWRPIGGEGGHVERGPLSSRERKIWRHFSSEGERVDGEQILSGPGLVRLYLAVMAADGSNPEFSTPQEILDSGLAGKAGALETLEHFAVHLGRLAGDLALVFMARGGVYISGGIGLRLAQFLPKSGFRQAFDDKPPYRELMRTMTVRTIIHPQPALLGLSRLVQMSGKFAPIGRSWRASGEMNG